jgi:hypothetical protein
MENNKSTLKRHLFNLAEEDREALAFIRKELELSSDALTVRIALRELARRLKEKKTQGKD